MTEKRRKVTPTVFCIILNDSNQVLLLRRANTGWLDGFYDLPAGHLHDQEHLKEGAIRELYEETGLRVVPEHLKLVQIHQNHHNQEEPYYGHIFLAQKWEGEPKNMEPDKADDMNFFPLNKLPDKTTPYVKDTLENLGQDEVMITYHAPGSIKTN